MTQANLEALTREVERQSAIVDCKNLMGKVMYYGAAWLNRKMVELWSRRDDCLLEQPWGISGETESAWSAAIFRRLWRSAYTGLGGKA